MAFSESSSGPERQFPDELEIDRMVTAFARTGTIFVDEGLNEIEHERYQALMRLPRSRDLFTTTNRLMREPREAQVGLPNPRPVTGLDIVSHVYNTLKTEEMAADERVRDARLAGDDLGAEFINSQTQQHVTIPRVTLFYAYRHLRKPR